jgi:hypothetical protein
MILSPGKIVSPDLAYVFGLFVLTYILEIFTESTLLQIIIFFCEAGFFLVWGRNITKLLIDKPITPKELINTEENPTDSTTEL